MLKTLKWIYQLGYNKGKKDGSREAYKDINIAEAVKEPTNKEPPKKGV